MAPHNTLPILSKPQVGVLLRGNSIYLNTGTDQETVLFYDACGDVRVLHGTGVRDSGRWTLNEDGSYCIDWMNGPKQSGSRVHGQAGTIQLCSLAGEPRGRVVRIVPGLVPELHDDHFRMTAAA